MLEAWECAFFVRDTARVNQKTSGYGGANEDKSDPYDVGGMGVHFCEKYDKTLIVRVNHEAEQAVGWMWRVNRGAGVRGGTHAAMIIGRSWGVQIVLTGDLSEASSVWMDASGWIPCTHLRCPRDAHSSIQRASTRQTRAFGGNSLTMVDGTRCIVVS